MSDYKLPDHVQNYFDRLNSETNRAYDLAKRAREQGYDPATEVEVQIAKNMAERVVGLVSVLAPQIVGSGVVERIQELEQEYGVLDWRVAMIASLEVARQKFCTFKDQREAMEVGIRVGFAYVTNGVVSSPLEGFVRLELGKRNDDGKEYFRIFFAGPVRNAGGTAASVAVIIADYVRKHMGFAEYDPTEEEVARCFVEIGNYHERVANLQYFPSQRESDFLVSHMPIEVAGDPTEKFEVSNHKNLPRVDTNKLRAGYCLIYSSCIPLKGPKIWKQLSKWGGEMGMEHWNFLEDFLHIQHEEKAKSGSSKKKGDSDAKISPVYTYIADLVAGRPVFGHPLRPGAFRLRYGRSRLSGLSGQAIHPVTSLVVNEFIATGSQLKVERPGKAAAYTMCDQLEGPVVRLKNGDVLQLTTEEQARHYKNDVEKILYTGDVLICYGDFLDRAHPLVPAGYCEEWWVQELKKAGCEVPDELWNNPITTIVPYDEAVQYSKEFGVPLHPRFTYFYSVASVEQLRLVWEAVRKAPAKPQLIFRNSQELKKALEVLAVPHRLVQDEYLVVQGDHAKTLRYSFSREAPLEAADWQSFMQAVSPAFIRDKAGTFIGSRLGRPEKAKMRKLKGSPHAMFPVAEEGGRLRSLTEAIEIGRVTAHFETYFCPTCQKDSVLRRCVVCEGWCEERWFCKTCGTTDHEECPRGERHSRSKELSLPIKDYFEFALKRMGTKVYPDLIKGVRGTSNKDHSVEHPMKGVLRARHDIYVNKDGTIRYDASEVPVTHFRCDEIGISAEKACELGYVTDIHGAPIEREDQVIEMFPQDVILPAADDGPDEKSDDVLFRTANFIDEMLVQLYGLEPFYNAKSPADMVGHLVLALAPHTSAAAVGRIIGFSQTQGLFFHPYLHSATRRDCDGDEGCVFLVLDAFLNFSKRYLPTSRGGTMDAPLVLTTVLAPAEVDDMVFHMDIAWRYPLDLYEAALEYKMPWDVKIAVIENVLGTPEEFYSMGFTHDTTSINAGNRCSAYKTLPTMRDKLESQMDLAMKLDCVDERDVARLVIEKHFIRDLKGNLRKFSMQAFRCVKCNEAFRRPPLRGNCKCGGRIIFTISEGSVVKYLEPAESLVKKYNLDPYLAQSIELTRRRVEEVFGKDPEKQLGLGAWFG